MRSKSRLIATVSILSLLVLAGFVVASRHFYSTTANEQEEQWMVSGHNFDPGTSYAATRASCVKCHDSASFVKIQVKGEELPISDGGTPDDPGDDGPADLEEPAEFGHTCTTCHDVENPTNILALHMAGDVTLPAYGDVVSAGVSASCMSCHNARRENPPEYILGSRRGSHGGPQADMLSGTGAIDFGETLGSSMHTVVTTKGCVDCHMASDPIAGGFGQNQVGDHTFKMHWDGGTPDNPNDDVENVQACQKCHAGLDTFDIPAKGDYDGDGEMEGVQTEVAGLLEAVAAELPQNEDGEVSISVDETTPEQRMANFNYTLVLNDGSLGIHNTVYAVQALRASYKSLTGNDFPGDKPLGVPLTANRPVTSDAIDKRLEQWEMASHNFDGADEHYIEEFHEAPVRTSCVRCHAGDEFVRIAVKGEDPPEENLAEGSPISCRTCHAIDDATNILRLNMVGDITLPAYGDVVDAGVSAACMYCHNARRENPEEYVLTRFRGTHEGPQADMLAGKSAIDYGEELESSTHFDAVEKKCVGCHMAKTPDGPGKDMVGEHTFSMVSEDGVENVGACQSCHGDITTFDFPAKEDVDGDGVIEGVQTEIDGMLALLASVLPQDEEGNVSIPSDLELTTVEQRMANYNYTLVNNDGSRGIHNLRYAVSVLRAAYRDLTGLEIGEPAGDGKDYSNVFFAELSQGLNMMSVPLQPVIQYSARTLAETTSATMVIDFDEDLQQFVAFTPDAPDNANFDINGGEGYIVNVLEDRTVAFSGAAWTNNPSVLSAPPAVLANDAWAFVVSGSVLDGDMMSASDGVYTVMVRNLTTGAIVAETTPDAGGYFAAAWADLSRKAVIEAGDKIEVEVTDASGEIVAGPFVQKITLDAIRNAVADMNLKLGDIVPERSVLLQNYPNPFNPETWIPYHLKDAENVSIRIYGAAGQLVRTLDLGYKDAGIYSSRSKAAYWDGRNEAGEQISSGIYFYNMTTGDFSSTRKMIITR